MTGDEAFTAYKHLPLSESIGPVARALATQTLLVGIDGDVPPAGGTLLLRGSNDKQGRLWAHAFTDEGEIWLAFPDGCKCAAVPFQALLRIILSDPGFSGGIIINSSSASAYPIFRELFDAAQEAMRSVVESE